MEILEAVGAVTLGFACVAVVGHFTSKKKYQQLQETVERLETRLREVERGPVIRVYKQYPGLLSHYHRMRYAEISMESILRDLMRRAGVELKYQPGTDATAVVADKEQPEAK